MKTLDKKIVIVNYLMELETSARLLQHVGVSITISHDISSVLEIPDEALKDIPSERFQYRLLKIFR